MIQFDVHIFFIHGLGFDQVANVLQMDLKLPTIEMKWPQNKHRSFIWTIRLLQNTPGPRDDDKFPKKLQPLL